MCLFACPAYRVEIDAAGLVTFDSERSNVEPSVPCRGVRQWRIDPAAVARLETLIDRSGFFAFKDSYVGDVTDMPPFDVTITHRGRSKHVHDYVGQMVGMPKAMADIEQAIDVAAGDHDCVVAKSPAATTP